MSLRPRRRNLVVWSSSAVPAGRPASARPARARRIRWWLRTGVLLMILGVLRVARTTRARWEPVLILAGAALTVAGVMVPAATAFYGGLLGLIAILLRGIREQRPAGS